MNENSLGGLKDCFHCRRHFVTSGSGIARCHCTVEYGNNGSKNIRYLPLIEAVLGICICSTSKPFDYARSFAAVFVFDHESTKPPDSLFAGFSFCQLGVASIHTLLGFFHLSPPRYNCSATFLSSRLRSYMCQPGPARFPVHPKP